MEQIWDLVTNAGSAFMEWLSRSLTRLFGSSNERQIRRMGYIRRRQQVTIVPGTLLARINELEPKMQALNDAELKEMTAKFRRRLADGESLDDLLVEAFAAARESGRRYLKMRHFDVQLLGGMVLHHGKISEMVTGEGKTLVATLAAYLNALPGRGVHVVTVNDYLARRDREWMGPLYTGLGLTVGAIQSEMEASERQAHYSCDITYGTNNEFGFDYLRDNMKAARWGDNRYPGWQQQCQRELYYAIIDEVDNILIDEARTPLIISGPAFDDPRRYAKANEIAKQLKRDTHFEVKEKEHTCHLTDEGVRKAEELVGVESFYTAGNMDWPHLIDQSLKAHHLYRRDKDYVVLGGAIIIVDEFTGRLMHGRQWSDGLHQAVEAKEGVRIKEETQTLATITIQNFFKLYKKLAGMTGTAMTEAGEFLKIYKLDVTAIPTNQPLIRVNHPDLVFRYEREKYKAIIDEIRTVYETGRPVLVGTTSIEKSEKLGAMLERCGIQHEVLNAKPENAGREAEIVAQAGRKGAVTLATNMAGRGTDIILGGNPEFVAWSILSKKYESRLDVPREEWEATVAEVERQEKMRDEGREVAALGGLHIVGTERHEARRIDNQLRGRAGRQGDPGSNRFFLALDDDLMRIFAGEWVSGVLTRLGMEEGQAIESGMVTRRIEAAQKKVEERNFDIRKNLLEYDEVMDEQRRRVYGYRQRILTGANCKELVLEMIDDQIGRAVDRFGTEQYGAESFADWASKKLGVEFEAKDLRSMTAEEAEVYVKDEALRQAESMTVEAIEENLPSDVEPAEWNWQAIANWANARWGLALKDKELKRIGREGLERFLYEEAQKSIGKVDLAAGKELLAEDWGRRSLCAWARHKFGMEMEPAELDRLAPDEIQELLKRKGREVYAQKEIEFPVSVAMARFLAERPGTGERYDREGLVEWANQRFRLDTVKQLNPADIRLKNRKEIHDILLRLSRDHARNGELLVEAEGRLERLYGGSNGEARNGEMPSSEAAGELAHWLDEALGQKVPAEELANQSPAQLRETVLNAIDDRYRPEMREMERTLLLQILDMAWKDHLYAMDHLRSSIGLRGYAQVDPKVEYKREGMAIFEEMWTGVQDRVTDLVFRMEQADAGFLGSLWRVQSAVHAEATPGGIQSQQEAAIYASQQTASRPEPIRHRGPRVGRNDPCPCGSGKKYKHCCMRKAAV